MINQEEPLRHYLAGPIRDNKPVTVLQLKISLIDESLRKDGLLSSITNSFYDVLALYGQAFCLKNHSGGIDQNVDVFFRRQKNRTGERITGKILFSAE